jgi:PAS domain S-box-containing protein
MNHAEMAVAASWDPQLVVLSYIVAVFASYTALDFAGKVTATRGRARIAWLAGGAIAMGIGIWSMHFTGMLAFKMPLPVTYDVPITLLSMAIAIGASALALFTVSRRTMRPIQFLFAGSVMGIGIASMHYTGMAAMQMPAAISYDPSLLALSVLIAIAASIAALWLAFRFGVANNAGGRWRWTKGGSALVMGTAIVGMHYTGMAAANFVGTHEGTVGASSGINTPALGFGIGIATLVILGLALVSSIVDRRFSVQARELERSERRYESLFRHNLDGVYSLDLDGKFLTANAAAEKITGYRAEELREKSFADLIVEEDSRRVFDHFDRAVWGEAQGYEIAITNKEGHRVELHVTNIPIVVTDEVVGIYGIAKDVTERKRAEREIRELNETLERRVAERTSQLQRHAATLREQAELLELTHDSVMVLDMDARIAFWNRGAEETYGWSKEEALGKVSHALLRARFPRPCEEIKAEVLREERWEGEVVHHKRDGTPIMVASRWALQRDERGDPVRILEINNDITERKALEKQLEHRASHDPLTGLPNRNLLVERMEQALARAEQRAGQRSPRSSSTWTTSRSLTTPLGTKRGMSCSSRSAGACGR